MEDCIFCKIIKGQIPTEIVYEDEKIICFKDISKAAKVHVLVVPKNHIENILDINDDGNLPNEIVKAIKKVAQIMQIDNKGFRIINNCKEYGGQSVNHLHFHILGGEKLNPNLI